MTLNGPRTKNSLTSPPDLDTQSSVRSQSREFSVSKEHQLTLDINSNPMFKFHRWSQTLPSTSKKVKSFTRMLELASGSNSGKPVLSPFSVCLQDSTFSRYIKVTVLLPFNGWLTTGIGMISQDNSKMVPVGASKVSDIAMTMTT